MTTSEDQTTNSSETADSNRVYVRDILDGYQRAHRTRKLDVTNSNDKQVKLVQRNYVGERIAGEVVLSGRERSQLRHIPANGKVPAYDHVKVEGIDVHLRDGLKPDPRTGVIKGLIEVKLRKIEPRNGGGKTNYYLYMNIFPLQEGKETDRIVTISHRVDDGTEFETVFVPNREQEVQQGFICVYAPPAPVVSAKPAAT